METIHVPDFAEQKLRFVPATGAKKSLTGVSAPASSLSLGGPIALALSAEAVKANPDLINFAAEAEKTFRFWFVTLACKFDPKDGEAFKKAWTRSI
jgi:hypothetical protein